MSDRIPHDWVEMFGGPWFIGDPKQEYKITLEDIRHLITLRNRMDERHAATQKWRNTGRLKPSRKTPRQLCDVLNRIEEEHLFGKEEEARRNFASYLEAHAISQEVTL